MHFNETFICTQLFIKLVLCSACFTHSSFEIKPILSKAVSPHFSHTCFPCSGSVFLLLQNISFPEWDWNISFCFSGLLTLLTKPLLTHLWPQIYCSLTAATPFYIIWHILWFYDHKFYFHLSWNDIVDKCVCLLMSRITYLYQTRFLPGLYFISVTVSVLNKQRHRINLQVCCSLSRGKMIDDENIKTSSFELPSLPVNL